MNIANDVFQIREDGKNYIYVPLERRFLEVGDDIIQLLKEVSEGKEPEDKKYIDDLKKRNILVDSEDGRQTIEQIIEFSPTSVTLLPTTDCILRCVYCYSNAGDVPVKNMSWGTAKKAINLIAFNAVKTNNELIDLCFHGGGEPFLAWNLMKEAVSYAQDKAKSSEKGIKITAVTNGVLTEQKLEWILENNINLSLSFDGPEDIQNKQRPTKEGNPTYDSVLRTVRFLEENKLKYGIRATVTHNSINRLAEIVSFFTSIAPSAVGYALEPLNKCGRCTKTNTPSVDMDEFAEGFIKAKRSLSQECQKKVHYSGVRPHTLVSNFCGASGKNFFVGPEGNVSSCLEVSSLLDPRSETFIYGKESEHGFDFDTDKLGLLSSICVGNIPHCKPCFAKYSCAGDCPSRSSNNGDVFDTSGNSRCTANRKILFYHLTEGEQGGK